MKRFSKVLIYHLTIGLIIGIASCSSTRVAFEKASAQMPFDAIIVPGVPFDTAWSDVMRMRVLWSYHLYKSGVTKNVIYSGSAVYTPYVESRIMAEYAKKLGIPEDHIFTEERAEHSTENVFYSYYMGRDLGFQKIALATDPFQTVMVKSFIRKKNLDLAYVPAIFDTVRAYENIEVEKIDQSVAFVEDFVPLPERENRWKRFEGTLGKNLKYTPDQITDASMKLR